MAFYPEFFTVVGIVVVGGLAILGLLSLVALLYAGWLEFNKEDK